MTIEQLSGVRLVISLSQEDMKGFALDYSNIYFEDEIFKKVLKRLIRLAQERITISIKNKTLFVEAIERFGGCLLVITVLPKHGSSGRKYRLKHSGSPIMFYFDSADALTDCMAQLYKNGFRLLRGEVFSTGSSYGFIVRPCQSRIDRAFGLLSEYSSGKTENEIKIASFREHCAALVSGFPVMKIGSAFAVKK